MQEEKKSFCCWSKFFCCCKQKRVKKPSLFIVPPEGRSSTYSTPPSASSTSTGSNSSDDANSSPDSSPNLSSSPGGRVSPLELPPRPSPITISTLTLDVIAESTTYKGYYAGIIEKIRGWCDILSRLQDTKLIDEKCCPQQGSSTNSWKSYFFRKKKIDIAQFWQAQGIDMAELAELVKQLAVDYEKYQAYLGHKAVIVKYDPSSLSGIQDWKNSTSPAKAGLEDILDLVKKHNAKKLFLALLETCQQTIVEVLRQQHGGGNEFRKSELATQKFINNGLPEYLNNSTPRLQAPDAPLGWQLERTVAMNGLQ